MHVEARTWQQSTLEAAVVSGGGTIAHDVGAADAIIWARHEPAELKAMLHPRIQWVQLSSAGVEDWFDEGVIDNVRLWTSAKGTSAGPIAEHVVAMLLAATRRLPEIVGRLSWDPVEPGMLSGKTVGIVGAGHIGAAILLLLAALRVVTIALTRSGRPVEGACVSVGPDGLGKLLSESDFVVVALPATPATRGLIGAKELAAMHSKAWLVNVGRGSVVDTPALVDALATARIGGAALDVTQPEPLPEDHPLWRYEKVIVTAHTASTARLSADAFATRVRENVERWRSGRPLIAIVNPETGY